MITAREAMEIVLEKELAGINESIISAANKGLWSIECRLTNQQIGVLKTNGYKIFRDLNTPSGMFSISWEV